MCFVYAVLMDVNKKTAERWGISAITPHPPHRRPYVAQTHQMHVSNADKQESAINTPQNRGSILTIRVFRPNHIHP